MTTFFLDLWHDLREKRLWPVAAGLAIAIVAVPIALTKSASQPSSATTQPAAQKAQRLPAVSLDQSSIADSHLDVFKERNPFKDLADQVGSPGTSTQPGAPSSALGGSPLTGAAPGGSGSSGGSGSGSGSGSTSAGRSALSGGTGGGSGGVAPSGGGTGGGSVTPGWHYFTFTADVRFGQVGHVHTYNGISQLTLLPPDSKAKVLSFYGVADGAQEAVFFNYHGLQAVGEGTCQDSCLMVTLKPGQEETLWAGQTAYTLKLLALHTQEVSKDQALGNTTPSSGTGNSSLKAASTKHQDTLLALPRGAFKL
ncbi:MAG: hypothetical protein JOZ25_00085 [Actinobacteria bacterium]|nr:hypothetical protein [Actinomycetota bacterium]